MTQKLPEDNAMVVRRTSSSNVFSVSGHSPCSDSIILSTLGAPTETAWRIVRSARCKTWSALFNEFAAALQFPWYFGNNLDALQECVHDFYWLDARSVSVVMDDLPSMLSDEASNSMTRLLKCFEDGRLDEESNRDESPRRLYAICCSDFSGETELELALGKSGIDVLEEISLRELLDATNPQRAKG